MNLLSNHLLLVSCVELIVCAVLALSYRKGARGLRAALALSSLAALLFLGLTAFPPWSAELALAAMLLSAIHVIFGFGLRRLGGERLPKILVEMTIFVGYAGVFALTLSRLGVNLTGLLATSAVATALIGLSMQESLSNLVAGISLQLEQSITTGDWIKTNGGTGQVKYVRLRHTMIETADADHILVPNSALTKTEVTILSLKRRRLTPFLVPYGEAPTRIMAVAEEALRARRIPGVAMEPAPRCILIEFQAQSMQLGVYLWLERPGHEQTPVSEAMVRVYFALSRIGVQVGLSPHLLEMRPADAEAGEAARGALHPEAALASMELFRALSDEEARALAKGMSKLSFAPEETILRQGDQGDSLYFIAQGTVKVMIGDTDHPLEEVAALRAGSFFGEMSLLTGEPRSATVIAATQVDCWLLRKPAIQEIFDRRPELLHDVAEVLAARSAELVEARRKLHLETSLKPRGENHGTILARIQRFFAA